MSTETIHLERLESPLGRIEITSDGERITSLSIERDGRLPHDGDDAVSDAVLAEASRQLGEYFAGERTDFDLPVLLAGTPFQQAVWAELQQLDFGQFTSYGEIGAAIGRPGSGRAIGGAVGANPVPIIVGCHRVLSSTGRITGFSAGEGIPTKVWLLDHESIGHSVAAEATARALAEPAAASVAPAASVAS